MDYNSIIQLVTTIVVAAATIIIAKSNNHLTKNTEKFNESQVIIDFQDKLSNAILKERKIIKMAAELKAIEYIPFLDDPDTYNHVNSFTIQYLNLVNAIAYLMTMKKSTLNNHADYFGLYIGYGNDLLELREKHLQDQIKYWRYIPECTKKYNMDSEKTIPKVIEDFYDYYHFHI